MDVIKMLAELRQERDQLEEAILTLERLARGRGRRRGRPPAWMTELKRRGRPPGSKNKAKESTGAQRTRKRSGANARLGSLNRSARRRNGSRSQGAYRFPRRFCGF